MSPELKAQWVAALRSGKYKQGKTRLYTKEYNSYCCMGVLCAIANKPYTYVDGGGKGVPADEDCEAMGLPIYNIAASNYFPEDNRIIDGLVDVSTLCALNDRLNKSFNEIADYIEKATF